MATLDSSTSEQPQAYGKNLSETCSVQNEEPSPAKPQSESSPVSTARLVEKRLVNIDYLISLLVWETTKSNQPTNGMSEEFLSHHGRNPILQSTLTKIPKRQLPSLVIPKTLGAGPCDPIWEQCVTIQISNMLKTYSARSFGGQNHPTFWGQNRSIIILRTRPLIITREKEDKKNQVEDRLKGARTGSFTPTIGDNKTWNHEQLTDELTHRKYYFSTLVMRGGSESTPTTKH